MPTDFIVIAVELRPAHTGHTRAEVALGTGIRIVACPAHRDMRAAGGRVTAIGRTTISILTNEGVSGNAAVLATYIVHGTGIIIIARPLIEGVHTACRIIAAVKRTAFGIVAIDQR